MPLEGQVFAVVPGRAGRVRITCAEHGGELGWVAIAGTPYQTLAGPDGAFRLDGVPPGRHLLRAWRPPTDDADIALSGEITVDLAAGGTAAAAIVLARP